MDRAQIRLANVRTLITESGGPAEFGRRVGMSDSQVSQFAGKNPKRGIGNVVAERIEQAFERSPGWLDQPHGLDEIQTEEPNPSKPIKAGWRRVPVVGTASLGDDGYWAEIEYPVGHGDGYIEWPTQDPNAYAIRCRGDSMRPRLKHGEFVIVEPGTEPHPGDEVLVKARDGRVMVKELVAVRDGMVRLLSVNETHGAISMPLEQIEVMHFVGGLARRSKWVPSDPPPPGQKPRLVKSDE